MKNTFMKVIAVIAIMLISASMAYAWDQTHHVKVAPNAKGDLIIFPFYFSEAGGWETQLSVINTSPRYSVVAKVVLRSYYYSEELIDFLIYLTPADVWTGKVISDGNDAFISSTDDSMVQAFQGGDPLSPVFASESTPVNQNIFDPTCTDVAPFDTEKWGYAEVIELWYGDLAVPGAYPDGYPAPSAYNNVGFNVPDSARRERPVDKRYLYAAYNAWVGPGDFPTLSPQSAPGAPRIVANSNDNTINVLTASMQFQNLTVNGLTSAMRPTILADFDSQDANQTPNIVTGFQGILSMNTLGEVEAALAKDSLAMEYVNQGGDTAVHLFNFPTKVSQFDTEDDDDADGSDFCQYLNGGNQVLDLLELPHLFWHDNVEQPARTQYRCIAYDAFVYDLEENLGVIVEEGDPYSGGEEGEPEGDVFCAELNFITPGDFEQIFDEGWINYQFNYVDRTSNFNNPTDFVHKSDLVDGTVDDLYHYYGTPVLGVVLKFVNGGAKMMPAAYEDGLVFNVPFAQAAPARIPWYDATNAGSWLPNYQYYNEIAYPDSMNPASFPPTGLDEVSTTATGYIVP